MGGRGSGNFKERSGKRGLTSEHRQLDSFSLMPALRLMKLKNLETHNSTISWPDTSKVLCRLHADCLKIAYKHKGESFTGAFQLTGIPNNYGGQERVYFMCPYCNRRSRLLYLKAARFKCRKCAKLNYESQQSGRGERLAAVKVVSFMWSRFKASPPTAAPADIARYTPPRPKGMHSATYERLLGELATHQKRYMAEYRKQTRLPGRGIASAPDGLLAGG